MNNKHEVPLFYKGKGKGKGKPKPIRIPSKVYNEDLEKENLQSDVDKFREEIEEMDTVKSRGELIAERSLALKNELKEQSKNPKFQIDEREPPCFGDECIMSGGKTQKTVKRKKHKHTTQKRKKARKIKTAKK